MAKLDDANNGLKGKYNLLKDAAANLNDKLVVSEIAADKANEALAMSRVSFLWKLKIVIKSSIKSDFATMKEVMDKLTAERNELKKAMLEGASVREIVDKVQAATYTAPNRRQGNIKNFFLKIKTWL